MTRLTKDQEIAVFAQVNASNPRFVDWLEGEREDAYLHLSRQRDPVSIHQAQGKVQLVEKMIAMLVGANKLLHQP